MSSNPDRTPVAQDVFTYCTKEKTDTWHVVRNHNGNGIVDRVICKSCGSEHKYRLAKAAAAPAKSTRSVVVRGSAPRASAPAAPSAGVLEATWFAGIKKWGEKPVACFDPETSFGPGDVFDHEVFGKGVVQTRRENKIDVLFKAGLKTLPSKRA